MSTLTTGFPENIVDMLAVQLNDIEDGSVVKRACRPTDASRTVGIYAASWNPLEDSYEMGREDPTLNRYNIVVQNFVKSGEEAVGRRDHARISTIIRRRLQFDASLVTAVRSLTETTSEFIERVKKYRVARQIFSIGPVDNTFYYLASTDVWIETETEVPY